jgi:peptide/nickel transport system ATP-binding protein
VTEPILHIDDLHIEFEVPDGRLKAINGISLSVLPGEIFGIVGETGCGKSITGLSVLQLLPETARVTRGRITLGDIDILGQSEEQMRKIRGGRVAMVFQDPTMSLNPVFTIAEQMDRVIRTQLGVSKGEARQLSEEVLTNVGLADVERIRKSYPHQLSGGMKQRVMVAIALTCRPSLLIADEPTTALDVTIQAQILILLKDLQHKYGIAIMFITHNLGVVAQICDRVAVLYAGRVVETADTHTLFTTPHHPYTKGLLEAVPRPGSRGGQLMAIPGSVPANPGEVTGCTFAERCPYVMDRCWLERPPLAGMGPDHLSACFLQPGYEAIKKDTPNMEGGEAS